MHYEIIGKNNTMSSRFPGNIGISRRDCELEVDEVVESKDRRFVTKPCHSLRSIRQSTFATS